MSAKCVVVQHCCLLTRLFCLLWCPPVCATLLHMQVRVVYEGAVTLTPAQLLVLMRHQVIVNNTINWSSKVGCALEQQGHWGCACARVLQVVSAS